MSVHVGEAATAAKFPAAAKKLMGNTQMRHNVRHATDVIQNKRAKVVNEVGDWEQLRESAHEIKQHTLRHLDFYLEQFEAACRSAGGQVHWARDADEANGIVIGLLRSHQATEVIKVKTMTSDEIGMNAALEEAGITPIETDLADLIVQLGEDKPSHIVVPALHRNKMEIRQLFMKKMQLTELGDQPEELAAAARTYLREKFLRVPVAISGANFAVADTGTVCVVESEGNGRMCVTLPEVLISLVGIEKLIPRFEDLAVFLQLLPRSATGERMNPYNSFWTGVTANDGPREFHVILLNNGRTEVLKDEESRETLDCIRCGACLNVCPVYRQTGGHAYGSVYAGPIGAILTPQLQSMDHSQSLPYASSLCGACYDVCPVKINIPENPDSSAQRDCGTTRRSVDRADGHADGSIGVVDIVQSENGSVAGKAGQIPFSSDGVIKQLPGLLSGWTAVRDLNSIPKESFRRWWKNRPNSHD